MMMQRRSIIKLITALGATILTACGEGPTIPRETVLKPGERIWAHNRFGQVKITYVDQKTRTFDFDGQSKTISMTPRKERFGGRLGLYDPAESWAFSSSIRVVCDESAINFDNLDEVYAFLWRQSEVVDWVYTPDGLVIGFGRTPARQQVNVDLYQLLVRGKKPVGLRNARPNAVRLITDVKT